MGWLIALTVLLLIAAIPLGVLVRYDSRGPLVRVIAGFVRFTVIPVPERTKKPKKEKSPKAEAPQSRLPSRPKRKPKRRAAAFGIFSPW